MEYFRILLIDLNEFIIRILCSSIWFKISPNFQTFFYPVTLNDQWRYIGFFGWQLFHYL